MSLTKAVQFRSLVAQLTPPETTSFIKDVADSNPQMIIVALFSYFMNGLPIKDNGADYDQCTESISSIIQLRKSQPENPSPIKFDALPICAIGNCGSYLDYKSYGRLSTVNRATYLGCNSPNMVTEMFVSYKSATDHQCLDFSAFPFANQVGLWSDWDSGHQSILSYKRMETIALQISKMPRLQSLRLFVDPRFIKIIANHQSTNQRTRYLSADLFDLNCADHINEKLISSMSMFKHVECLHLMMDHEPTSADKSGASTKSIIEMCRNLKGLDFHDCGPCIAASIIQAIGHQLHYLHVYDERDALKQVNCGNLREIRQEVCCELDSLRAVLKSAVNVEKIKLTYQGLTVIKELLDKYDRLKYMEIDSSIDDAIAALEKCLFQIQKLCRNTFKIRIDGCFNGSSRSAVSFRIKWFVAALGSIVNQFSVSKVDQWMIIMIGTDLWGSSPMACSKIIRYIFEGLRNTVPNEMAQIEVIEGIEGSKKVTLLITNPGCTIAGWRESWIMNE